MNFSVSLIILENNRILTPTTILETPFNWNTFLNPFQGLWILFLFCSHSFYYDFSCFILIICLSLSLEYRSSGEGHGTPLQYSCLENLMDRLKNLMDRQAKVHRVAQRQTWLKGLSRHHCSIWLSKVIAMHYLSLFLAHNWR